MKHEESAVSEKNAYSRETVANPIFVVGPPRSGTHLMRYCLSQHSNIYIAPETNFFLSIFGSRALIKSKDISRNAEKIVDYLFRSGDPSIHEFGLIRGSLEKDIRENVRNYKDLADCIFSSFASYKGKPRWGEKTPLHLQYLDEIYSFYPGAKIVCMTRSTLNIVASYAQSSHMRAGLAYATAETCDCLRMIEKNRDRMLLVRYEELLDKPENVLSTVAAYIGEEFESEMLKPKMRDSSYGNAAMEFDASIGIESHPDERNKWRKVLSECEARTVDAYLQKGLAAVFIKDLDKPLLAEIVLRAILYSLNKKKNRFGLFYWKDWYFSNLAARS